MLFAEISSLRGVGPARVEAFARLGIRRVYDLITHLPRRYEDRRHQAPIGGLKPGQRALIVGQLLELQSRRLRPRLNLHTATLSDPTGTIRVQFFNQDYILGRTRPGHTWGVFGQVDWYAREKVFTLKEIDLRSEGRELGLGSIFPFYPATAQTNQKYLRALIPDVVRQMTKTGGHTELYAGLPDLAEAARLVHIPRSPEEPELGRRRLAMDELVMVRLCVERARLSRPAIPAPPTTTATTVALDLPFQLTAEQQRAMTAIRDDLAAGKPMRRLLEGDVGSGKTVLAILAAADVAERGQKTAFLAPTEILAEQHFLGWSQRLAAAGLPAHLLTGGVKARDRKPVLAAASGDAPAIVFGTHALLEDAIAFAHLGLVVIDEQQRFGVVQRDTILRKGEAQGASPHLLTLTATPIPRTLAMTLYGDLEITTLRERLPGRTPVTTLHLPDAERKKMMPFIRSTLARGERIYIVYPIIEEDDRERPEEEALRDAKGQFKKIAAAFPEHPTALLTGAMKPSEKEKIMRRFRDGDIHILVATTVIEVGIDVPEATLMILEHAEHFGLAQLHQLRGRVGRGGRPGTCILTTADDPGEYALQRIQVLLTCDDGFLIAEKDLDLRGPGEILGERQSGSSQLRAARLGADADLIPLAVSHAREIVEADPRLATHAFQREYVATAEQPGAALL